MKIHTRRTGSSRSPLGCGHSKPAVPSLGTLPASLFLDINTYSGFKTGLRSRKYFSCSHNSAKWFFFQTFPQISMLAPKQELGVSASKRATKEKVKWEMQLKGRVYKDLPTSKHWHRSQFWQGRLEADHTIMAVIDWIKMPHLQIWDTNSFTPPSLSERCRHDNSSVQTVKG